MRSTNVLLARGTVGVILVLLLVAVGCGGQGGGGEDQSSGETSITVATIPIDAQSQVFYAQDMGFFEEAGLSVEIQTLTSGPAIASAVASGAVDIGCSNVLSLATAHEEGLPFVLIAPSGRYLSDEPTSVLMVAEDSPIQSASDLNGKTIAVNGLKNITQVASEAWIDQNGGDSSTVEFVEIPFPQMADALEQGRVDAALIAEPALTQAGDKARVLGKAYDAVADEFLISAYFANQDWVNNNPETARKFAEVIQRTAEWANENPEESAEILQNYTEITPETINSMTRSTTAESLDPALIQPVIDAAAEYEVIESPFNASEFISTEVQAS